jgi:c(7)-type cytochrome triheme protein
MGNVTFNHAAHSKRANEDCKTCHDKLFTQSKAPLNYKGAMHKTAEAAKTSCAGCHNPGGAAFETKGNCNKCHVKG